jgi:putative flippase GtrA
MILINKISNILFKVKTHNILIQFFRYLFVGGTAFLIDYLLLIFLTDNIKVHYLVSAVISFIIGLTVNYSLSKLWIFNNNMQERNVFLEIFVFLITGLIGLLFNELILWIFTEKIMISYKLSKLISAFIILLWNFLSRKYILFNNNPKESEPLP